VHRIFLGNDEAPDSRSNPISSVRSFKPSTTFRVVQFLNVNCTFAASVAGSPTGAVLATAVGCPSSKRDGEDFVLLRHLKIAEAQ